MGFINSGGKGGGVTSGELQSAIETAESYTDSEITKVVDGTIAELQSAVDTETSERKAAITEVKSLIADTDVGDLAIRMNSIENDLPIQRNGKIYGVKFPLASYSGSPEGERTEAAVGLTAAVSTDTEAAANDFDNEPCFMFTRVNGYLTEDNDFIETAVEGEPLFSADGSNGDVYVRWSTRFFRYIYTETHEELQITDIYRPNEGWCPYGIFVKPDGRLSKYAYIAAYEMSYNSDGLAASISGAPVAHNTYANRNAATAGLSHNTQLTEIRKKGTQYCGMTSKEVAFLQDLFSVEFATRNSQSVMQGCTNFNYQKTLSAEETGVSRVIVSNANAAYYPVGCTVSVSASGLSSAPDRSGSNAHTTVNRKRVISQEAYDDDNTAIYIDNGGTTFDTTTTMYISTMPWYTGMTDGVLGSSGSPVSNTSGYYPMKYRGVENLYGNVWTIISDMILSSYTPYICYDCTKFSTSVTSDYTAASYTVATTNGYVKEMGHDADNASVRLPITVGGSASTYYCDYYWVTSGVRECLFGGYLFNGAYAGVWYWSLYSALSASYWAIASRLSASGRSGVYAA